jgi:hypothetical protein
MKPKKTKRVPEDTLRIFPQTPHRDAASGKTYETFVSEMAEIMESFVPLDFSTPEAAARSMKEMERRRGTEAMAADRSYRGNRSSVSLVAGVRKSTGVKRIKYRPPEGSETK